MIIDCFAGGGGASVGIEMALGVPVDIAMNHNNTHCLDFRDDCPKECFRAKLVRDLDKRHLDRIGISLASFRGTEECMREGEKDEPEMLHDLPAR